MDEVPPDVARPVHGLAAEQHQPGVALRQDGDPVAGPEDQEPAGTEDVAGDVDLARDDVDRPSV